LGASEIMKIAKGANIASADLALFDLQERHHHVGDVGILGVLEAAGVCGLMSLSVPNRRLN
jgi:hypothetical protein